jgi:hypothetical protein
MNIDIEETPSVDDPTREELLWCSRYEDLCDGWMQDSITRSKKHGRLANKFKCRANIFGFLNIFLPLLLASSTPFIIDEYTIMYQVLLFVVSLSAGTTALFKYENKYCKHSEYENKYLEFVDDVRSELVRPKRHRMAADVFVERTKNQHSKLLSGAPDI